MVDELAERQSEATRARLVLDDARQALSHHRTTFSGPAFRSSWFAVVGLLRAVGHVLEKCDAAADPHLSKAVDASWKELNASKPEPPIFWGFIDAERNRFLKNYEHGLHSVQIYRTGNSTTVKALDLANAGIATQLITVHNVPLAVPDRSIISILSDGPFVGRPHAVIAALAIEWWEQYLSRVEALTRQ